MVLTEHAVLQTTVEDKESGNNVAAVNCYFMSQDGSMFKAQVHFSPYFYLQIKVRCSVPSALPVPEGLAAMSLNFCRKAPLLLCPVVLPSPEALVTISFACCWKHASTALRLMFLVPKQRSGSTVCPRRLPF